MEKKKNRSSLVIAAAVLCCVLAGCGQDARENGSPSEPDAYERGYDLPVDPVEQEEASRDCGEMMKAICAIYEEADKGTAVNAVISRETAETMQQAVGEKGVPAVLSGFEGNMLNYEKIDQFLKDASEGRNSETILYRIHTDGTVSREKFTYDGQNMYSFYTKADWSDSLEPVCGSGSYARLNEWSYTDKGWFCYEYCTAQPPELTEVIDAYEMVRVMPLPEEYRKMQESWLMPVGYQGNNLFSLEWSEENMEQLDYNGLFEYFYQMEYGERIDEEHYAAGIPGSEFEDLMTKYLPVTEEQLREYASYDAESGRYHWVRLGVGNYAPNAFWVSVPEVTGIRENEDGTVTLTVDVVCEQKGNDDFYTHEVTLRILDDGEAQYLSNDRLDDRPGMIPDYQYRCG